MTFRSFRYFPLCFALAVTSTVAAQGPPAGAGQNIQSLANELAALTARVAKLEGQIAAADLVGTYAVHGIQVELRSPNNGAATQVASYVIVGTAVLASDGTFSLSGTEDGSKLLFGTLTVAPHQVSNAPFNSTWGYNNGTVTISGLSLGVAAGGRLLVGASANHSDGTNVILLLTRLK